MDASALLAILLREDEADRFAFFLSRARRAVASPVNIWEAAVRARALKGAAGVDELQRLLARLEVRTIAIDEQQLWHAVEASGRYGRGTPANLNLGDCFAYALATSEDLPLLFKGADFPLTDVRAVPDLAFPQPFP